MNYQQTTEFLFKRFASYQQHGSKAFKNDLANIIALCKHLEEPQNSFRSIHVGGTNGKGSCANILTSVFMEASYKVGTFTSPHYFDFRERIRINGTCISENDVVQFTEMIMDFILEIQPSFFEITVAMAFWYFRKEKVDIAIIEVGLGGRLDSTNNIQPELSIITNIGYDHQQFLGNSLKEIAIEKAGIIKKNIPVVIGKTQAETKKEFEKIARQKNSQIHFADQTITAEFGKINFETLYREVKIFFDNELKLQTDSPLLANFQRENIQSTYLAFELLKSKFHLSEKHFQLGLQNLNVNSRIIGRWEVIGKQPLIIADSCHNEQGVEEFFKQISKKDVQELHIIYGCVSDKNVKKIMAHFPPYAQIYLTQPSIERKMNIEKLQSFFPKNTATFPDLATALSSVKNLAKENDIITIIGSIFLISDLANLSYIRPIC